MRTIFFSTKKQVVKLNEKYAARFKKWWHTEWTYIGIETTWSEKYIYKDYDSNSQVASLTLFYTQPPK